MPTIICKLNNPCPNKKVKRITTLAVPVYWCVCEVNEQKQTKFLNSPPPPLKKGQTDHQEGGGKQHLQGKIKKKKMTTLCEWEHF